jgi:peptidoglycan/xylan/chitin deacetylase (PgdA/CDA1 family)
LNKNDNTVCLTIDVEPDFGGLSGPNYYFGKYHLSKLKEIINRYDLRITAFVTGKTLEDNPDILDSLRSMNAEIEQHSYAHQVRGKNKISDIQKGIEVHKKITGNLPIGYRSPQGVITKSEILFLEKMGIKYDSSIFPSFFPGRFNRLNFPSEPFMVKDTNIMEIPFAVIPKIRIPIGLSYMQLLGMDVFTHLFKIFGIPSLLVYDFHTYELGKVSSYDKLSFATKMGYYRSQKKYKDPFTVFERFIKFIISKQYESKYLSNIYHDLKQKVPIWNWSSQI